jgi:hypothetical protein
MPVAGLPYAEYVQAITAAAKRWNTTLAVTAAVTGEIGSSIAELTRIAAVLALVVSAPDSSDRDIWTRWDTSWPPQP